MDTFASLMPSMGFRPPGLGAFTPSSPQATTRKGGRGGGGPHRKSCNCKNSRCLKLYCECFASGRYCEGCNCTNCCNNHENEHTRQSAVEAILERNPNAFRPKIQAGDEPMLASSAPRHALSMPDAVGKHSKGCNCKKSACLKKYCECFQAAVFCSDACKCMECKNFEGSEQRAQAIACLNLQPSGHGDPHSPQPSPMKRMRGTMGVGGMPGTSYGTMMMPGRTSSMPAPQPTRPMLHQVVGDIVKGSVIEELCRLLFLVADEEAERHVTATNTTATPTDTTTTTTTTTAAVSPTPATDAAAGSAAAAPAAAGAAPAAATPAGTAVAPAVAVRQPTLQESQERVVLSEFIDMFRKMTETANKKAAQQQQAAAAAVAAAAAAVAAASGGQGGSLSAFGSGGVPANVMAAAAAAAAAVINRPMAPSQAGGAAARPQASGLPASFLLPRPAAASTAAANALAATGSQLTSLSSQAAQQQHQQGQLAQLPGLAGLDAAILAAAVAAGAGGGGGGTFTSMLTDTAGLSSLLGLPAGMAGGAGAGAGTRPMQLGGGQQQPPLAGAPPSVQWPDAALASGGVQGAGAGVVGREDAQDSSMLGWADQAATLGQEEEGTAAGMALAAWGDDSVPGGLV